jgi:hypothetical protein
MTFNNDSSPEHDLALHLSRRSLLQTAAVSLAALICPRELRAVLSAPVTPGSRRTFDFRYSPQWWQTLISLPDDPDKALVGKEGQLFFDYGRRAKTEGKAGSEPTGMRNFAILLQPDIAGGTVWRKQGMISPRVPIVQTSRDAGGIEVCEDTFLVTPGAGENVAPPRLARMDRPGLRMFGGTEPARIYSPVFTGAAIGEDIHFQFAVASGASVTVVYGLCMGPTMDQGARTLVLSADGAEARTVDPVKDFGVNQPGVYKLTANDANRDGVIDIHVNRLAGARGHAAMLNALWIFPNAAPPDEAILDGRADRLALASFPAILQPSRRLLILTTLKNSSAVAATLQPVLRIRSVDAVTLDQANGVVYVGRGTCVSASASLTLVRSETANEFSAQIPAVTLQPGESHEAVFTVDRHPAGPAGKLSADQAHALRTEAEQWWGNYDLPYSAIEVPDPNIQKILDSCVRNIWQARELKIGGPAFQVGPTCYRGLWMVDGAFLLESAAMLGRGLDARSGIEYLLNQQKPDGSFELLPLYWKENGIVLWAATRHAFLTQDKEWLRQHWPALQRVLEAIRQMRNNVSKDPQALNYRLMPGGFVDGGIEGTGEPEYSTVYWTLAGMNSFIAAAHWLGDEPSAASIQKEYGDLYAVFRRACARDMLKDGHGNAYVPMMMGNLNNLTPQKGQWSFCHAVYPGQVFSKDDPLVNNQLAMLRATYVEGMVCDTGNIDGGIWSYFASFYGHAQLWLGHGREAADSLYAFAQHACPTRVWREEQRPLGQAPRPGDSEGDMPHNWASAEFIRLAMHLIEIDRGDELHLLQGFPRDWAGPGMVTRLNGVLTPFGPLHLEIRVSGDGHSARLKMKQLTGSRPAKVVLHLDGLDGTNDAVELPTDRDLVRIVKCSVLA